MATMMLPREDTRRWTVTRPAGVGYAALADDHEVTMLVGRTGQCWYNGIRCAHPSATEAQSTTETATCLTRSDA